MEKFQKFLGEYHNSILSSSPLKKTKSQSPYFDVEMKNKTFFHKGSSYSVPMFRISLKIPGDYINEIKDLPRFRKINEEMEKLKEKARENKIQIQTDNEGGVEFYRKLYYNDVLEKISREEAVKLNEMSIQKKYLQNQIVKNKLHPQAKKFLQTEFYKKFKEVQHILEKIVKEKNNSHSDKPNLRIVK